jgi:pimeloyl-ACP methyl ester carboxylesterase
MQSALVGEIEQRMVPTPDGTALCAYRLGQGEKTILLPNAVYLLEHFAWLASDYVLVAYDLRHRGRSLKIDDRALLHRGIHHDVEDLETIRSAFKVETGHVIGHSYLGLMAVLYALSYPGRTDRIVQIGPVATDSSRAWPESLRANDLGAIVTCDEAVLLQQLRDGGIDQSDPEAFCHAWWAFMRKVFVYDPDKAAGIGDHFCAMENEWPVNMERHLHDNIMPSIDRLGALDADLAELATPVLTIHGRADRNVPYGAGREWAMRLGDARLVTVPEAAHLPFLDRPEIVQPAIRQFLAGHWPQGSEQVTEV